MSATSSEGRVERLHACQGRTRSSLMAPLTKDGQWTPCVHRGWDSGTGLMLWDGGGTLIWVPVLAQFITCFVTLSKMFIFSRVSICSNDKMNRDFLLHS